MHEVAIMQNAVDLVLEHARRAHAARVRVVTLRIGELSGVCEEALTQAFEIVTAGTPADGAKLETIPERVHYRCRVCALEFIPESVFWHCPACGGEDVSLLGGHELDLVSLEVE